MTRLVGFAWFFVIMFFGWMGAGLFMLLAPVRFGNLIHESFGVLPRITPHDRGKKLAIRIVGVALLGFAVRFAFGVGLLVSRL
jgi:hypothetical protein